MTTHYFNPEKNTRTVLLILTLFAVIGPISIDIFTPSLPAITDYFATEHTIALWSVGIFMVGFSISMLICGPLADHFGRKKTLIGGYSLYLLATLIILQTDSIYTFIAARFMQAVFGCFGTAIARTLARDYYKDKMEVKMLAYIGGCLSIAPMLAPIAGGFIQEYAGWHYSFIVMAVMAILALLAINLLPERYQPAPAQKNTPIITAYQSVLTDTRYLRYTVAAGAAFAGAFVFVAGGSFVFIDQLGITPQAYGILFAVPIAGYMISAAYVPRLNEQFSRSICLKLSGALLLTGSLVCLVSGYLTEGQSISGYITGIVIYELGLGIYMPICQAKATEHLKHHIGTASGLIFFIEVILSAIISGIAGLLPETGTLSLSVITLAAVFLSSACIANINKA